MSGIHPLDFIGKDKRTRLLDYFVSFIQQNMFTMGFSSIVPDLLPLISTSPLLYHAVIAVGALDANRHTGGRALQGEKPPYVDAMTSYHKSISILRFCVGKSNVMQREDVLWATFFLGLFEVCFLSERVSSIGCIKSGLTDIDTPSCFQTIRARAGLSTCSMEHQKCSSLQDQVIACQRPEGYSTTCFVFSKPVEHYSSMKKQSFLRNAGFDSKTACREMPLAGSPWKRL